MRLSLAVSLLVVFSGACDGASPEAAPSEPNQPAAHGHSESHAKQPSAATDPETARFIRVTRFQGEARANGQPFAVGARLQPDSALSAGPGSSIVLDTPDRARFELAESSEAAVGGDVPQQLLLFRGMARGIMPPEGNSSRPPLRIAMPLATVEIGGTGTVWAVALPSGSAWVAVLSGTARVFGGVQGADGRLASHALHAGQAILLPSEHGEPEPGPEEAEQAAAQVRALLSGDAAPSRAALDQRFQRAIADFDSALRALEQERARGADLNNRHRQAIEASSDNKAELARAIIEHSQLQTRLAQVALARWERLGAQNEHLRGLGFGSGAEPVALRRERARRAILGE